MSALISSNSIFGSVSQLCFAFNSTVFGLSSRLNQSKQKFLNCSELIDWRNCEAVFNHFALGFAAFADLQCTKRSDQHCCSSIGNALILFDALSLHASPGDRGKADLLGSLSNSRARSTKRRFSASP